MRRPSSTVREGFQTETFLVRSDPSWSSLFPTVEVSSRAVFECPCASKTPSYNTVWYCRHRGTATQLHEQIPYSVPIPIRYEPLIQVHRFRSGTSSVDTSSRLHHNSSIYSVDSTTNPHNYSIEVRGNPVDRFIYSGVDSL